MARHFYEYNLLYVKLTEKALPKDHDAVECSDEKCDRLIYEEDFCFIDTSGDGGILCELCGKCVRYARKKEAERQQLAMEKK